MTVLHLIRIFLRRISHDTLDATVIAEVTSGVELTYRSCSRYGFNIRCQALAKSTPTLNMKMRIARCCCCSVKTACLVFGILGIVGGIYGRSRHIIPILISDYKIQEPVLIIDKLLQRFISILAPCSVQSDLNSEHSISKISI